ncbi:MAG: cyclic nucleotide-binding domain-containing protein [Candidatus Latescibacteria bacterium]|nr:cyclic nucleotide-binding domain-containing protein [Candidatus Latescibacterota bacterium]
MEHLAVLLWESPLFSGLEDREVRRLVDLSRQLNFNPGDIIVAQGSAGDSLYLLHSGELEVSAMGEKGRIVPLATLDEPGAFFGEVSLVDHGPRSATVRALTDAVVLRITLEAFERFFIEFEDAQVMVLRNLARVLAQRLRHSNVVIGSISLAG